jgi:hypothetical protein
MEIFSEGITRCNGHNLDDIIPLFAHVDVIGMMGPCGFGEASPMVEHFGYF